MASGLGPTAKAPAVMMTAAINETTIDRRPAVGSLAPSLIGV
jgi:hypothetical protein